MFSLRPVLQSLALLVVLVPSSSVVFAQQQEDDEIATIMPSDDNTASALLLTNYNALREEGQGFYLRENHVLYEKPDSVMAFSDSLQWLCELEFLSDTAETNNYGYVGRAVLYLLGSSLEDRLAQGAQSFTFKKRAVSVSAVMVPTLGIFEAQVHVTTDDWVYRYWDDGSSTLPTLGWEGHDEGDTTPNAGTSAFSGSGTITKITTEAAAELLGVDVADLTPATCSMEYKAAWNATHVPDPIDTSVIALEEEVAQLHADINELRSLIANGSGDDGKPTATSSSPLLMRYNYDCMDIVMKSIMTVATIIGFVAIDFI